LKNLIKPSKVLKTLEGWLFGRMGDSMGRIDLQTPRLDLPTPPVERLS